MVIILDENGFCISYPNSGVTVTTDEVSVRALEDRRLRRELTKTNLEINIQIRIGQGELYECK